MTPPAQTAPARAAADDWPGLMARAQQGDAAAYRALLLGISPYLRAIARRAHRDPSDAEDAVQDILLTLHSIRHTYDPERPFKPWLAGIARHRIADRLRRSGRRAAFEVSFDPEHETFADDGANSDSIALDQHALEAGLAALPPGQREAITLVKLREMSLQEASKASGMSAGSLKVATHRGIKALRRLLGHGDDAS